MNRKCKQVRQVERNISNQNRQKPRQEGPDMALKIVSQQRGKQPTAYIKIKSRTEARGSIKSQGTHQQQTPKSTRLHRQQ